MNPNSLKRDYKLKIYYFTPDKHAVSNIKERHLKLSRAASVNDIFEMFPFNFGNGEITDNRENRKKWREEVEWISEKEGFISFSESWKSPIMWGHYANNHQGVCYEFEADQKELTTIEYPANRVKFDHTAFEDETVLAEQLDIARKTKSAPWSYENEIRRYFKLTNAVLKTNCENKLHFWSFKDDLKLTKIFLGTRSKLKPQDFPSIQHDDTAVEIVSVRAAFQSYSMTEQLNPKLRK